MESMSSGSQDPSELIVDRLSSLPWNVLDIILGKLSLVDTVRTSVLAKAWQYKWLSVSKFALSTGNLKWDTAATIINTFLLHQTCSIQTFSLGAFCSAHYPDLYQWIQHLSKQNVEVMELEELGSQRFEVPSYLFSFEKLKYLSLRACGLRIPNTFGRFNSLSELSFNNVSINVDDFDHLIRSCPLLLKLTLRNMSGLEHLSIRSPRLNVLLIDTGFEKVAIRNASCLVTVGIDCIRPTFGFEHEQRVILNWRSVIRSLSGLKSLRNLILSGEFIKLLAADYALEDFPLRNNNLTFLNLNMVRFENIQVFRICLSVLRSCPNIKDFQIKIESASGPNLITTLLKENKGRFSFPKLESLKVKCPGITTMGSVVNFIEFLGVHSPNLKFLSIEKIGGERELNDEVVSKLRSRFKKSCPHAVVLVKHTRYQTYEFLP